MILRYHHLRFADHVELDTSDDQALHLQIRRHPDGRLDLAQLARSASYSPCHLIRIYREVFDETPTEYAMRLRSNRAWQLVRDTAMPVYEITEALGFESQSAFCRAFKHAFGLTATEARRRSNHLAASAA